MLSCSISCHILTWWVRLARWWLGIVLAKIRRLGKLVRILWSIFLRTKLMSSCRLSWVWSSIMVSWFIKERKSSCLIICWLFLIVLSWMILSTKSRKKFLKNSISLRLLRKTSTSSNRKMAKSRKVMINLRKK